MTDFHETTLALHIQEGRATDPAITTALVKQFAPGVQRLTLSLLNGRPDATLTARVITQHTFAIALNDPESFAGKDNIRTWLYAQALHLTRELPPSQQAHPTPAGKPSSYIDALPTQESLSVLLRYGHRLPLQDIAHLLRTSEDKIHKHLSKARGKLVAQDHSVGKQVGDSVIRRFSEGAIQRFPRTHFPRETQRFLDHLLDPAAESTFRDHVDTCPACQGHLKQFTDLETDLSTQLFHESQLPEEQTQAILHAVLNREISVPTRKWQTPAFLTRLPIREMSWVVIAAAVFFILARWLNPYFSSPPPKTTPTPQVTPALPQAQNLTTVFRQSDPISSALANPSAGQHVIWSLTDVRTANQSPTNAAVTFSYPGAYAAYSVENDLILWELAETNPQTTLIGHESLITAIEFSRSATALASGDQAGNVLIWNTADGSLHFHLKDHPGQIWSLAFSPNGQYLAVGVKEGVWVWEIKEKTVIRVRTIAYNTTGRMAFSPDNAWLAVADQQGNITIQSIPDGKILLRYKILPNPDETRKNFVTQLGFSPDGKKLASVSLNGRLEIVALNATSDKKIQGTRLYVVQHPSFINDLSWSLDGKLLATVSDIEDSSQGALSASRMVFLWSVENGTLATAPLTAPIAEGVNRVMFTSAGNELWVGNLYGGIFQWKVEDVSHLVAAVPESRFFTRTATNLTEVLPSEPAPTIGFIDPVHALVGFPALSLSPLPAQYSFVEGKYSVLDAVVEMNYRSPTWNMVRITQRQLPTDDLTPNLEIVGASAVIQPVQINGIIGEYVAGSWIQTFADNLDNPDASPIFRWQASGEARLRWIQGSFLMEIQTPLIQYDENNLTLNDLVRLAENLAAQSDPPTLLTYTVQEGDTCIGIALRYGTTMERIIEFNQMENCDLIVTDQILLIPLPTGRETVAEVDLNCDGLLERVRAIPDPNLLDLSANFGVVVEAIPPGGDQYWPIWELTLADLPVAFFGLPVIYPESECGGFLAVSLFGGTSEFSGVDLYRWNGTTFDRVLDANGYTTEVFSPPAGGTDPFRITTQSLVRDFVNGGCTRTITTYEWNGSIFNEVEQTVAEGVDCLEGGG